jgi:uncharacterized repeat protein (TIGR03803 family)
MPTKRYLTSFFAAFLCFGFLTATDPLFAAGKEKLLYSFEGNPNGTDGFDPRAGLIFDAAGNLYGTTQFGGSDGSNCTHLGCGTVFELVPGTGGKWTEKVLYSFCSAGASGCHDGSLPGANLVFDAAGNLYGTTEDGGAYGVGTVFQLSPNTNGRWTEKVLHSFGNGTDESQPAGSLIFDPAGNLYGTTTNGGTYGSGTVFQLSRGTNGKWTEKVLHTFGKSKDGNTPVAGLIFDAAGNLYGATDGGGAYAGGTVFQLSRGTNGKWTEKVLHTFGKGKDGKKPVAGLIFDAAGNLYGTTADGGAYGSNDCGFDTGCGTAFQLSPGANETWTERALHSFGNGTDGAQPGARLIFDAAGNLYGTTELGGVYGGGTAFRLKLGTNGKWTERVLHSFGNGMDGIGPSANDGLIFDAAGDLYGTTMVGGSHLLGTVFEITP